LLPKTDVTEVSIEDEKVTGVQPTKGPLHAQVAEACDIRVPLVPIRQQLIVTEALEAADPPMVRIMDAAVDIRPCREASCWVSMRKIPASSI
jgi:hypothetical protein